MATRPLPVGSEQAARLLLAIQAGDAVACATLPIIQRDLVRLGCPPWLRRTLSAVKAASAVGLLAGRRDPRLGRLTTDALVVYFLGALGAHARVRDPAWRWAAATGMLGLVLYARQAYAQEETAIALPDETIDLTEPVQGAEPAVAGEDRTAESRAGLPSRR